jgi:hypothetical protein
LIRSGSYLEAESSKLGCLGGYDMRKISTVRRDALVLACLTTFILLTSAAFAKQHKLYPQEGKVVGTGVLEHHVGYYSHTYTVQTSEKVLLLDCDKSGSFLHRTGEECGGNKKLQVGDVIHFRLEKEWLYLPVTETFADIDNIDRQQQTEQRLRVVKEELKSAK